MTKTEKYSSCIYDKKLRGFILAEPWIRQPVRGGRGWPASPGVPRGPAGSSRPGLWLGICPDHQVPVLSFVRQAGDVTIDYAGVKESILAENTSEIEKYSSSKYGVVWGTHVLETIGRQVWMQIFLLMTQSRHPSKLCVSCDQRHPVTLH